MKLILQLAACLALAPVAPAVAQDLTGSFHPEKSSYLVGEPIFIVLEMTNTSSRVLQRDDAHCWPMAGWFDPPQSINKIAPSLYGCIGDGWAGSCAGSIMPWQPGEMVKARILLDGTFSISSPGVYHFRAHYRATVGDFKGTSRPATSQEITTEFEVSVRHGKETDLVSVFQPILRDLDSSDFRTKGLAFRAVMQNPPLFLEDVILRLADDPTTAAGSVDGLERLPTPRARAKLVQLTGPENDTYVRQQALRALGLLGDPADCPILLGLVQNQEKALGSISPLAAGAACGKTALPFLMSLLSSGDSDLRKQAAFALGNTQAREAVPILIPLVKDENEYVRFAAGKGLLTLTHHDSGDLRDTVIAERAYINWTRWWTLNGATAPIYGLRQCGELNSPAGSTRSPSSLEPKQ